MKRIGITGASGFIGHNATKYFSNRGYNIIAFGKKSESITGVDL